MDLVMTLGAGAVIGWLASLLTDAEEHVGLLGSVILGVLGSVIGQWLAGALGIAVASSPARWLFGLLGAVLLLGLLKATVLPRPSPSRRPL